MLEFIKKRVTEWTVEELREAVRYDQERPGVIAEPTMDVVRARLESIRAQRQLSEQKISHAKEKRKLLVSFVDKSSKPAQSIDVVSVRQSLEDATTTKKGGGPAITIGSLALAYDWLSGHPELTDLLFRIPPVLLIAAAGLGIGWWIILFVARLTQKWSEEYH